MTTTVETEDFVDRLITAPDSARLLWTDEVRQWLYDRSEEIIPILETRHMESPARFRAVELLVILASAYRRTDNPQKAREVLEKAYDFILTEEKMNAQTTDKNTANYLRRKIGGESATVRALQGDYANAAKYWYRAANHCATEAGDPSIATERAHARRHGAIYALYDLLDKGTDPHRIAIAREQLKDAGELLWGLVPTKETEIQVRMDILYADWYLGIENLQAPGWISGMGNAIAESPALVRAFDWSWRILRAAYAARSGDETEQNDAYESVRDFVRDSPKAPLEYRMHALLALAKIEYKQEAYERALSLYRQIVRTKSYNGPAKFLARDIIIKIMEEIDPQ